MAKTTQQWLQRNFPAFISTKNWPSGNPDLNPLDYKLWAVLEDVACQKRHNNLESLKRSLILYITVCNITIFKKHTGNQM
jgi:hypothetical protein